jgi:predicted ribosome quality control (RQC) complex YloA/Tae2 family protein
MHLDVFTISALVDEFLDTLVGGRVQDSIDVDHTGLGLEIYANHTRQYLYLSADPRSPRVHRVDDKLRRGLVKPTQLGLLFRRYVEGGIITHVSQPPWERILQMDVDGPEGEVSIVIEPMERRSNILLVQAGVIIDCMRRVGPDENRYRVSLPTHEYRLPPPQTGKRDPLSTKIEDVEGIFQQNTDAKLKAHQLLTSRLLGMSPLLAKEIVYRANGDANLRASDANPDSILEALQSVTAPLAKRQWQPGIVENDNAVQAFSVYPIESMLGWRSVATVSEALTAYYSAPIGADAYKEAKIPVREAIQEARGRLNGKLASLERSLTDGSEREMLRQSGELILAYQYDLRPGQTELQAQYDPNAPELTISLESTLSPVENAQHYFDRYNRAKRALEDVPRLVRETKNELTYLSQLDTDLELATNWPEIDEVQQALQAEGYWRGKPAKRGGGGGKSAPLRLVTEDNFIVWVGRNSRQNEMVTFDKGRDQDLWLHARDVPGAHVVVKFDGRSTPESVIELAASLAAYYSAKRGEGRVPVDVTRCKYVKKIKGAGQGLVTYRNEETRMAVPRSEQDFEL